MQQFFDLMNLEVVFNLGKYCVVRKNNTYIYTHTRMHAHAHEHTYILQVLDFESHGTTTPMVKFFYFCPIEKMNLTYQYVALKCCILVIYGKLFSKFYDSKMFHRR
jgi:hypothetical protein